MDHLRYFCIVFAMLSHLLIAVFWSPAGRGLNSCLSFVVLNCMVVTFPFGILSHVWYLIVLIPDLCSLSYFQHCTHSTIYTCCSGLVTGS